MTHRLSVPQMKMLARLIRLGSVDIMGSCTANVTPWRRTLVALERQGLVEITGCMAKITDNGRHASGCGTLLSRSEAGRRDANMKTDKDRKAMEKLFDDVEAAVDEYDKSGAHLKHTRAETDCIRCKLLRALGRTV